MKEEFEIYLQKDIDTLEKENSKLKVNIEHLTINSQQKDISNVYNPPKIIKSKCG